ncbi:NACHT domain family protein [Cylindrospermum sp. NIES-4074]|nr:NACHT domain family protein [Cylindrospermum sp. NIES-4074]
MQRLPRDFLTQMARKYELSPEQEEAFVERFSQNNEDEIELAEVLHITPNAFRTRMTGVYRKFSISGKGPGKFRKLHDFLVDDYQKSNPSPISADTKKDIAALVKEVREKIKPTIQERCGTMRVLDLTQPIGLNDIYTNVNILETITGRQRLGIDELLQQCTSEDFDRFGLGKINKKRVPGLDAVKKYPKLMILGKPGAGKTTFLKHLAMQCIGGRFQSERVPIFVTLKDFAEAANQPKLLKYISENAINRVSAKGGILETQFITFIQDVITHGKALVLLDGLDEVREEDSKRVLKDIEDFSKIFNENHFVITCRIAAKEYTFEKFTEVEIDDFDDEQIATFANNWFKHKAVKPETFIKRLEDNQPIKELASSPLLLTLLCLAFEESGDFPANRSELYKEGLDALLKKWDAKRGIQREQIYGKLSVQRKEDLLSRIALTTFEQSDYFFKQKIAEQYITKYIRNLPDANTDDKALELDSEKVLKSIEAQHGLLVERAKGIYSFSHLTFHEYFTAREFVVVKQSSEEALQSLVSHLTEKRWREVFLLSVGMSPSADRLLLLMKEKVDALIAADEKLQQFLMWVKQKSLSVKVPYKLTAVRAFYFDISLGHSLKHFLDGLLSYSLDYFLDHSLDRSLTSSLRLSRSLELDQSLELSLSFSRSLELSPFLDLKLNRDLDLDPEFKKVLKQLKDELPDREDEQKFKQWWEANSQIWRGQLRDAMIKYRNIGHDWQFTQQQKKVLQQYYDANKLLIDCLNSDCYVSREVRQYIEDTLLLPIEEIKNYKLKSNP